jgi:hypothetical protein
VISYNKYRKVDSDSRGYSLPRSVFNLLLAACPVVARGYERTSPYAESPHLARHFSVIQNDYDRGDYEQKAIPR